MRTFEAYAMSLAVMVSALLQSSCGNKKEQHNDRSQVATSSQPDATPKSGTENLEGSKATVQPGVIDPPLKTEVLEASTPAVAEPQVAPPPVTEPVKASDLEGSKAELLLSEHAIRCVRDDFNPNQQVVLICTFIAVLDDALCSTEYQLVDSKSGAIKSSWTDLNWQIKSREGLEAHVSVLGEANRGVLVLEFNAIGAEASDASLEMKKAATVALNLSDAADTHLVDPLDASHASVKSIDELLATIQLGFSGTFGGESYQASTDVAVKELIWKSPDKAATVLGCTATPTLVP